MTDTRVLLDKITAFRQRLESMPRLVPQAANESPNAPPRTRDDAGTAELVSQVRAGSRTQAVIERSLRQLTGLTEGSGPCPAELTPRAKRVLEEA